MVYSSSLDTKRHREQTLLGHWGHIQTGAGHFMEDLHVILLYQPCWTSADEII